MQPRRRRILRQSSLRYEPPPPHRTITWLLNLSFPILNSIFLGIQEAKREKHKINRRSTDHETTSAGENASCAAAANGSDLSVSKNSCRTAGPPFRPPRDHLRLTKSYSRTFTQGPDSEVGAPRPGCLFKGGGSRFVWPWSSCSRDAKKNSGFIHIDPARWFGSKDPIKVPALATKRGGSARSSGTLISFQTLSRHDRNKG
jgi:hypothetical protein